MLAGLGLSLHTWVRERIFVMKCERKFKAGDVMHLGIEKLGEQKQNVVAWLDLGGEVLP
jgi:hypothetical protein